MTVVGNKIFVPTFFSIKGSKYSVVDSIAF